jgi:hypothetical protein
LVFFGGYTPWFCQDEQSARQALTPINAHFNAHAPFTMCKNEYDPEIDDVHPTEPRRRQLYTAMSYALSSGGARILLDLIDKKGFTPRGSLDSMLVKLLDLTDTAYALNPFLTKFPKSANPASELYDTDIWSNTFQIPGSPDFRL